MHPDTTTTGGARTPRGLPPPLITGTEHPRPIRRRYAVGQRVRVVDPESEHLDAAGIVTAVEAAALPGAWRYRVGGPDWWGHFGAGQLALDAERMSE
jgi:hypothetical protein